MDVLLDSNILIPLLAGRSHDLPPTILGLLASAETRCHVSAASLWEVAIKVRLGKLELAVGLDEIIPSLSKAGLRVLRITEYHAVAEALPIPPTRDPFDRLLLAQCAMESLRLVTLDRALADHPLAWRVA